MKKKKLSVKPKKMIKDDDIKRPPHYPHVKIELSGTKTETAASIER